MLIEIPRYFSKSCEEWFRNNKSLVRRIVYIFSLICILIAAFLAWEDQYNKANELQEDLTELTETQLNLEIVEISIGKAGKGTAIVLLASVANKGAPSVLDGYTLRVTTLDGKVQKAFIRQFDNVRIVPEKNYSPITLKSDDFLFKKTIPDPVQTGQKINGHILFFLPVGESELIKSGVKYTLSCRDIYGKEHSDSFTLTDGKRGGSIKHIYPDITIERGENR